ncbi:kinase-like protein [Aspergillus indologenus CBS 114.80]|uniref:Kinase-like protein n=1 Tax=Aspergillus indologenus CBS 114.80 TaxID=1450541 RepID=A0A2V5ISB0_9EURO|nr:kinase-like protein [Aspergillus indologenus CBS 114.80]
MPHLWSWFTNISKAVSHFIYHASSLFSYISQTPQFIKSASFTPKKSHDLESNVPFDVPSGTSICETYTVRLQPQHDLDMVGVGASGQVYNVDDQVVLKTCRIFEPPSSDASQSDHWHYASDTVFHFNMLEDERTVLKLLQIRPHLHIIEAIDTDQPEGIYLRKYRRLAAEMVSTQSHRIRLYRDITDALRHLHSLGIAHADIRIDNILFDHHGSAILCDFSAASPFGQTNLVFPDLPLPVNGPFPTLSEASDMFAMASLIFRMEHGAAPELSFDQGTLILPEIRSGNQGIDEVIQKAWLGQYSSTSEMLQRLIHIDAQTSHRGEGTRPIPESGELFKDQIQRWRVHRKKEFGSVLAGLLSRHQLDELADCYSIDMDADLRLTHYCVP